MTVLIVTRSDDNAAPLRVMEALARRGVSSVRLDSDRYPDRVRVATRIDGPHVARTLNTSHQTLDLEDVGAVWYRRFNAGGALPDSLGDMLEPAVEESRRSLYGLIAGLDVFQMDRLEDVRRCDHKERQLLRARALGLTVPRTLFTNDPVAARAFWEACDGDVVTKSQSSWAIEREGRQWVVFTSTVSRAALEDLSGLALCPMTFQQRIPAAFDVRATVVGDRVLAARVRPEAGTDWRKHGGALLKRWEPTTLPAAVERSLLQLMRDTGLCFGAADFVETPDGEHVFLEVNAGGEWLWLDQHPGLGIAEAIAHHLATACR